MKIAILSDIHGNSIALRSVLDDIKAQGGADIIWVIGDLVALGPDPIGVLEILDPLPNVACSRGNTDRYVTNGDRPTPYLDDVKDRETARIYGDVQATFAWTAGMITASGWQNWLADLPIELRQTLPDGTKILGVHSAPGTDDGFVFHRSVSEENQRAAMQGCNDDLIFVGHVHFPLEVNIDSWRILNSGGISNPIPPHLDAKYYFLTCTESSTKIDHRFVPYDRQSVIAQLKDVRHPAGEFIAQHMRGEFTPPWHKN